MTKGGQRATCTVFQHMEENGEEAGFSVDRRASRRQSKAAAALRLAWG
jgi:hypothetical protein